MRLIDADALKERLKEYCVDGDSEATEWYRMMGIDEEIDDAPTVDAVPVLHGRWIRSSPSSDGSERYVCSECNCGYAREAYRYCPACGAKMR